MKKKSLLVVCISAAVVLTFPYAVHAETINGFTRQDYLSAVYGLPPEKWTDSGSYTDENGGLYSVGKYDAEIDRRTVDCYYGGKYSGQVGYADANMNMVIPFTDKWDTIEDFYKGRALASHLERGMDTAGNYYSYDIKYVLDVNGNVLKEIRLKYSWDNNFSYGSNNNIYRGTFISTDGEKYYYQITGFKNPKESTGLDVEVIKYSDGSYYNYFYSFTDYPFLIDKYEEGEHGNKLMLANFEENGVAELYCHDTNSWKYSTPIGLGDSGWGYRKIIVLGKISIWGSVFEK